VAGGGEVRDSGGGQDRRIRPGVRRHVGDVGVVERRAVGATEIGAGIERSDERLRGWESREQVAGLRGDEDLLLPDGADDALLLGRRACLQELIQVPFAVGAKRKPGCFSARSIASSRIRLWIAATFAW